MSRKSLSKPTTRRPIFVAETLDFDFDALPALSAEYDPGKAQAAAERRAARKGQLALRAVTRGFASKTRLWVPHSKGESSAVINGPVEHARSAMYRYREGIQTKFPDDPPSDDLISSWIRYGTARAGRGVQSRYLAFSTDAHQNRDDLTSALGPDRSYDATAIRGSEAAMLGLFAYFRSLESFSGANNRSSGGNRSWVQERHVHVLEASRARFDTAVTALREEQVRELFDEAFWSEWSRELYWKQAYTQVEQELLRPYTNTPNTTELAPVEAYRNIPEYYGQGYDFDEVA